MTAPLAMAPPTNHCGSRSQRPHQGRLAHPNPSAILAKFCATRCHIPRSPLEIHHRAPWPIPAPMRDNPLRHQLANARRNRVQAMADGTARWLVPAFGGKKCEYQSLAGAVFFCQRRASLAVAATGFWQIVEQPEGR